ncbi:hypothetical protein [Undibacterium sp. Tian12W]|uniref:hypothetical protein n=1 Tax=Undibacterium sp. Tian12W TaxID=3413054 RepID=UPI003BF1C945
MIRILCHGWMFVGPLMLLLLLQPLFNWEVNGQEMTYLELWTTDTVVGLAVFLAMGTAGCWGMAARKPWARWVLVFMQPALLLMLALYPSTWMAQEGLNIADLALQTLIVSLCVYACLFHLPGMRRYYQAAEPALARGQL